MGSKSIVKAFTVAGYDTLNNKLAKKLSSVLANGNYTYAK